MIWPTWFLFSFNDLNDPLFLGLRRLLVVPIKSCKTDQLFDMSLRCITRSVQFSFIIPFPKRVPIPVYVLVYNDWLVIYNIRGSFTSTNTYLLVCNIEMYHIYKAYRALYLLYTTDVLTRIQSLWMNKYIPYTYTIILFVWIRIYRQTYRHITETLSSIDRSPCGWRNSIIMVATVWPLLEP